MTLPATTNRKVPKAPGNGFNRLLLGAFSRSPCLPNEDPAEWDALTQAFVDHYNPHGEVEASAVAEMVSLERRRRRLEWAEQALLMEAAMTAQEGYPEALKRLAMEVRGQQTEFQLLERLFAFVTDVYDEQNTRPAEARLRGLAVVLEGLVGWPLVFDWHGIEPCLKALAATISARKTALEASQATLNALMEASSTAMAAAQAQAGLLDPKLLARLRQEQVTVSRAVERQLKNLDRIRGTGVAFEGTVAVAKGVFHNSTIPPRQEEAA